jgi:hypothetical protein
MDPITGFFALLISILAICSMSAVIGIKKRLDEQINLQRDMIASVFILETIAKRLYPLESDHNESLNEKIGTLNVEDIKKEILTNLTQGALFLKSEVTKKFKIDEEQFNEICNILYIEKKIKASQRDRLMGK